VVVEAVKRAEDSDDLIIRLYECEHRDTRATLRFGFPVAAVSEANLMEETSVLCRYEKAGSIGTQAIRDQDASCS